MNDVVADTAKERASNCVQTTCSHHYQLSLLSLSNPDDVLTSILARRLAMNLVLYLQCKTRCHANAGTTARCAQYMSALKIIYRLSAKSPDDCARISTLQSHHYSAVKVFSKYSIQCKKCNLKIWKPTGVKKKFHLRCGG